MRDVLSRRACAAGEWRLRRQRRDRRRQGDALGSGRRPSKREYCREHGKRSDHCVCKIVGSVAESGSSFTGAYVISWKRAKYTSSSTTPSWLDWLKARSSPFAPSTVTS